MEYKMKNIIIALSLVLFLTGCCQKVVKVPVWTPPILEKVTRPTLLSDGIGTDGEIARKLSKDLNNITIYVEKLENNLNVVHNYSPK